MYELGLNAEALPLTSGPNIYGGAGSDEVSNEPQKNTTRSRIAVLITLDGSC